MKKNNKFLFTIASIFVVSLLFLPISTFGSVNKIVGKPIPKEVKKVAEDNLNKILKIAIKDLEEQKSEKFEISNFTLGNAYRLSYLKDNIESTYKKINKFEDFIQEKDEWLYTVNYKNNPIIYLTIAKIDDNYEVVSFGGNSEEFDNALKIYLEENNQLNDLKVVSYYNDYYFMNKDGDLFKVTSSKIESKSLGKSLSEKMDNKILYNVVKESIDKEVERKAKNQAIEYGYYSLLDLYNEFKNR